MRAKLPAVMAAIQDTHPDVVTEYLRLRQLTAEVIREHQELVARLAIAPAEVKEYVYGIDTAEKGLNLSEADTRRT